MKELWNRIRCLCGFHDNAKIPGDRICYDGEYRIVAVTYHVCRRCGKAYSAVAADAAMEPHGPGAA